MRQYIQSTDVHQFQGSRKAIGAGEKATNKTAVWYTSGRQNGAPNGGGALRLELRYPLLIRVVPSRRHSILGLQFFYVEGPAQARGNCRDTVMLVLARVAVLRAARHRLGPEPTLSNIEFFRLGDA